MVNKFYHSLIRSVSFLYCKVGESQLVTKNDKEWQQVVQGMTTRDNEWQRMERSGN